MLRATLEELAAFAALSSFLFVVFVWSAIACGA